MFVRQRAPWHLGMYSLDIKSKSMKWFWSACNATLHTLIRLCWCVVSYSSNAIHKRNRGEQASFLTLIHPMFDLMLPATLLQRSANTMVKLDLQLAMVFRQFQSFVERKSSILPSPAQPIPAALNFIENFTQFQTRPQAARTDVLLPFQAYSPYRL